MWKTKLRDASVKRLHVHSHLHISLGIQTAIVHVFTTKFQTKVNPEMKLMHFNAVEGVVLQQWGCQVLCLPP